MNRLLFCALLAACAGCSLDRKLSSMNDNVAILSEKAGRHLEDMSGNLKGMKEELPANLNKVESRVASMNDELGKHLGGMRETMTSMDTEMKGLRTAFSDKMELMVTKLDALNENLDDRLQDTTARVLKMNEDMNRDMGKMIDNTNRMKPIHEGTMAMQASLNDMLVQMKAMKEGLDVMNQRLAGPLTAAPYAIGGVIGAAVPLLLLAVFRPLRKAA